MTVKEFLDRIGGMDALLSAVQADDYRGYCLYCGEETYGVEPDARRYKCESCGRNGVFGAEEILIKIG